MRARSPGCLQPSPYRSIFSPGLILNTALSASLCLVLRGLICPGAEHLISLSGIDLEPGRFWRSLHGLRSHHHRRLAGRRRSLSSLCR